MLASETENAELIRRSDYDLWLACLYVPVAQRAAIHALYAFSLTLRHIHTQVSEPMLGEIRLQWWHDVMSGARADEAQGHPLAAHILRVINDYHLSREAFVQMIEAHRFDLYDDPMPSLHDLEGYCGETSSLVFRQAVLILNQGQEIECADAAGHAGVAYRLSQILHQFSHRRHEGKKYLPRDILARYGVESDALMAATWHPAMQQCGDDLVSHIDVHLRAAERAIAILPKQLRVAFLPLAFVSGFLSRAKADHYNLAALIPEPTSSPLSQLWRMWRYTRKDVFK